MPQEQSHDIWDNPKCFRVLLADDAQSAFLLFPADEFISDVSHATGSGPLRSLCIHSYSVAWIPPMADYSGI